MPTRVGTRISSILTGTRKLDLGYVYSVDNLNFQDPKSMVAFARLVTGTNNATTTTTSNSNHISVIETNNNDVKKKDSIDSSDSFDSDEPGYEDPDIVSFYQALRTDPKRGLSYDDLHDKDLFRNRVQQYGKNVLPTNPPKPFYMLVFEAMKDKVLIVLSIAAIVSLALGLYETFGQPPEYDPEGKKLPKVEWVEGVAIIVAILIVVIVGSVNDYQKERQFAKLNAKKEDKKVVVIRDGKESVISMYDLLVGDLVQVQTGDMIPGDGVMISGNCECDESALTGETKTIKKYGVGKCYKAFKKINPKNEENIDLATNDDVLDPFFISGAKVLNGFGTGLITAVGENSIHGKTMASLKTEPEVTPLQARLDNLANGISKYGLIAAVILFIVLFIRFLALLPAPHKYHDLTPAQKGEKFLNILITAITIVVVAVPEGLPLAVTLALAFATTRMAKDNNLVRVLKSCETMGGATAVCSDKTGTLTENRMRIVRGLVGNDLEFNNTGSNDSLDSAASDGSSANNTESSNICNVKSEEIKPQISKHLAHSFFVNSVLNSSAFETNEEEEEEAEGPEIQVPKKKKHWWSKAETKALKRPPEPFTGSKTEIALLILCQQLFDMKNEKSLPNLRSNVNLLGVERVVQVIQFESYRKWSGVVVKNLESNNYTLYIKGAAEIVARKATHLATNQGEPLPLHGDDKLGAKIDKKIDFYARNALRSICLAHIDLPNYQEFDGDEFFDKNLTADNGLIIDSIVGIQDPLREGVADAVTACQVAGVTVRMVTGDNLLTGKSIALGCGIIRPAELNQENVCMEGPSFRKLSSEEIKKIIPNLRVLARSSPQDKRILVQNLKEMGEVVAVTGDGTNDAPALKLANVGFSMGISGTDVAREASDIILMTDNFSAIVQAIKWGRCVAISIKKFIQFQLTVNVTAVVLTFVSAVASSNGASVLTAVQLLWVNLIMDTLAALALATDKPDDNILKSRPAGTKQPLISVAMWKMIMGQAVVQLVITFVLHFASREIFFGGKHFTAHNQTQLDAMTFNTFVWLQFFSMFVCRKLDEGDGITKVKDRISKRNLNFFEDLFRNWYFIGIMLIIGGFQVLIMFVGGAAFSVAKQTGAMWGTAIICGLLSIPAGWIIRIIPDSWVVRFFPFKAWHLFMYIISFDFLRKSKRKNFREITRLRLNSDLEQQQPQQQQNSQAHHPYEDSTTLTESASDKSAKKPTGTV